jgi:hypothetical protein
LWAALAEDPAFPGHERETFGLLEALWNLSRYHMPHSRQELANWLLCEANLLHRRVGKARHTPAAREKQKQVKKLARRATRKSQVKVRADRPRQMAGKKERLGLRMAA